jgi:uncharacterized protein (DUF1501 family)
MSEQHGHYACEDYRTTSRRQLLAKAGLATAAMAVPAWMPKMAFAHSHSSDRDVIIWVNLVGGCDGLSMVVPHGDPEYYAARPNIAIPQPGSGQAGRCTDLDGYFGLSGPMLDLLPAYQDGKLLIVNAVGRDNWTRSHFEAQKWVEAGSKEAVLGGWLGRHLACTAPMGTDGLIRALSFQASLTPALLGGPGVISARNPAEMTLGGGFNNDPELMSYLVRMYARNQDMTRDIVRGAANAVARIDGLNLDQYAPSGGASYTDTNFGSALKHSAALIKAEIGIEALHVERVGWDTHANQNPLDGTMFNLMRELSGNLGAFYRDMAASDKMNWVMVVTSEFGRTIRENGSNGTDHGTANCMFVMGGSVLGGRLAGTWPGIAPGQRFEGMDLRATTDYRTVLAEIIQKRLKNQNSQYVFPGFNAGAGIGAVAA